MFFTWTPETVLSAIDAGVAIVISTYNSSFTWALRQSNPIELHPFTPRTAHTFAMGATIDYLMRGEHELAAEREAQARMDAVIAA